MTKTFKHIGPMSSWGAFGQGTHDLACDAERRAMVAYFLRRLAKGENRNRPDAVHNILAGGATALAGLWQSGVGGPDAVTEEDFERFIEVATFAWYQALSVGAEGGTQ